MEILGRRVTASGQLGTNVFAGEWIYNNAKASTQSAMAETVSSATSHLSNPIQFAGAVGEGFGFDAETLKHGDKET